MKIRYQRVFETNFIVSLRFTDISAVIRVVSQIQFAPSWLFRVIFATTSWHHLMCFFFVFFDFFVLGNKGECEEQESMESVDPYVGKYAGLHLLESVIIYYCLAP